MRAAAWLFGKAGRLPGPSRPVFQLPGTVTASILNLTPSEIWGRALEPTG